MSWQISFHIFCLFFEDLHALEMLFLNSSNYKFGYFWSLSRLKAFKAFHSLVLICFLYLSPWTIKHPSHTEIPSFFRPFGIFILSALAPKSSSVLENFSPL